MRITELMGLEVFSSPEELARAAAEYFVLQSSKAVAHRGSFTVALSGGSTPRRLYELLADPNGSFRDRVRWDSTHFFWSDERHVPPDHSESNYRMAYEALLARVPVSRDKVHRITSENPSAEEAARAYEETILKQDRRGGPPWPPQTPHSKLDLVLLGLGTDGHTASIFPGSEVLHETTRLVAAPWVEKLKAYRITMTLPLLNNMTSVLFLVSGSEKAEILREVLQGPPDTYPAQAVRPLNGELLWMVDHDAASRLNSRAQATR